MNVNRVGDLEIITDHTQAEWLELRSKDITSTDAAALFGISPYMTEFELWHRKKDGAVVDFEPSERMKWGTRLQGAIAEGVAEDNNWKVRPMTEYIRLVKLQMGSSFDFEVMIENITACILEVKNVDAMAFKDGWLLEGDSVEAPPHIELQVQHQLDVSGKKTAYIAALIGGNRVVLIRRERDEAVINALESRIAKFWDSIRRNDPPKPDFVRDAEFISKLYKYAEPGKVIQGTPKMGEMVNEYQALGRGMKMADDARKGIKAELLTMIGEAEKVQGEGFSISAGMIGPADVAYTREAYRDFRTYIKKPKGVTA